MIDPAAHARLEQWKQSLLDLSAAGGPSDVPDDPDGHDDRGDRGRATAIPLPDVDPVQIAAALADGVAFILESGPPASLDVAGGGSGSGRLRSPLTRPALAERLVALRRAAQTQLADRGHHALWLGLGMLTWCEAVPDSRHAAVTARYAAVGADAEETPHPEHGSQGAAAGAARHDNTAASIDAPPEPAAAASPARDAAFDERSENTGGGHDGEVVLTAPLALWPVELVRAPDGALQLVGVTGLAPRCNPALAEKLRRDTGVVLPVHDELALGPLMEAVDQIAAERAGWRLERSAQLAACSVARLAMRSDLEALGGAVLRGPVVAQLARGTGLGFAQPSPEAARAVAGGAAADDELVAPLDADAGQLAAIAAAGAGASFVLHGPPGTGKSQTIANVLVDSMARAKSVLFVSAKRTALAVVQRRLGELGLGELCLELYEDKAARPVVLAQLGRVLERVFRPAAGRPADTRLRELAGVLDGHVAALHRVGPFGRSLHAVLGRLVELRGAPRAALADRDATGLDGPAFDRRMRAVEQLAAAAVVVEPIASHPWSASAMERWPADGRDRARAALDEAAAAAAAMAAAVQGVVALVPGLVARTRDQLQALGALAAVAAASPRPGAELLTQLRGPRGDDIVERIALIRARGAGSIEPPRDPSAFLVLASRHRLLATEVNDRFTDSVAALDAHALWAQLRRWTNRVAPLRFMALRQARAAVRAAAMPGMLETDGAMITALESVIAERAASAALTAAAEPARRWFGELGGDPLTLDLARIDAAVSWATELRRAFEAVEITRGDTGRAAAWRALVAQVAASPPAESPGGGELAAFARLAEAARRWQPALAALAEATGIDAVTLGAGDDHLAALRARITALVDALDAMHDWVVFHGARRAAQAAGVGPAVAALEIGGGVGAGELAAAWERATLLAWVEAELADTPALARFQGATHHASASAFADLDRAMLGMTRSLALIRLAERVPRLGSGALGGSPVPPGAAAGGEIATLVQELKDSTVQRPLRRLLAELPTLLPRLAPCLLMTPAAVAEHLDPALRFDLVVIDEASQLPTAEAIGALARGDAAMIVGDMQQLPPEPPGDGLAASGQPDSVLAACIAARLPELRLTSHYRSKHDDLIAFANQRYYAGELQVLPAAHRAPDLGVVWRRVDGIHDRAVTQQNRVEAEAVVAEVIARLRDPAQQARSLGVVTFARAQQALIEDLLDAARAGDPVLDGPLDPAARPEPVVVKTADAMQGDERDVVIVSIGCAPEAQGAAMTQLGPLSGPGGERWLNAATTCAREQLIVFSSFAPEDLASAEGQGAADLAALLAVIRDGGPARAARAGGEAPAAGPITAAIGRALGERGWTVHHQVGCGRYKLDLAIVDPNDADRYVLAIEHDGAVYASAPGARDRDRLRAQMLGQLGWRMHRIWALDWWTDPERELQRAHGAIVMAVAASRQRRPSSPPARAPFSRIADDAARPRYMSPRQGSAPTAHTGLARDARPAQGTGDQAPRPGSSPAARPSPRTRPDGGGSAGSLIGDTGSAAAATARPGSAADAVAAGSGPTDAVAALLGDTSAPVAKGSAPIHIARNTIAIGPYLAAAIPAGRRSPDDLFAPRHLGELGKIIEQVLAAEAPMHVDVLARRVGAYFGIGRLTPRVTDQVRVALAGRGQWGDESDVVWRLDQDPAGVPPVRVAGQGASARRAIDEVPLAEVAAAARIVVERASGLAANDLVRDAARLLGFARVTERVIERVATGVKLAARRELIRIEAGKAKLPD